MRSWWSLFQRNPAPLYTSLEGGIYNDKYENGATPVTTQRSGTTYRKLLYAIFLGFLILALHNSRSNTIRPRSWLDLPLHFEGIHRHIELNSTLGFQKVYAINMKRRADKRAEAAILGHLYNVDIDFAPGVVGTDVVKLEDPKDRRQNEIGAHRAHTDLWTRIVSEKISSALIFEDDFDWDENMRSQMHRLQEPLATFLASESQKSLSLNKKNPWNTHAWDILWLGTCQEGYWINEHKNEYLTFHDPTLVGNGSVVHRPSIWNFISDLNVSYPAEESQAHLRSRVIQRALVPMCTAGYAISHRGAMKLLYEVMHQEWKALDNRIADIGRSRKVKAYSVVPPIFSQFRYNYFHRDSDIAGPRGDWRFPKLPGSQGKSLSIKNSAKANLPARLAEM